MSLMQMLLAGSLALKRWNAADKTASVTLSNSDQTASVSGSPEGVRTLKSVASGSWYLEAKLDAGGQWFGVANSTHAFTTFPGNDANSTGLGLGSGNVWYNGAAVVTGLATIAAGDVIGVHVLFGSGIRFYKNGALLSSTFATIPAGPLMAIAANSSAGTSQFTLLAAQQHALPSGASYWPA